MMEKSGYKVFHNVTNVEMKAFKHTVFWAERKQTYNGATFSCLMKNMTFPTMPTALFRPSDRQSTVSFL